MIRIKFGFHATSLDILTKLADEKGVTAAEIVRRALSLYASCNKRLKSHPAVTILPRHLGD